MGWDGAPYTGAADRIPAYDGARHWYAADPRISHWSEQMQPVPLDLPQDGAPRRVYNLELPPNDYRTSIDWFFPGYYEWLNPTVFREYWKASDTQKLAQAGVALMFNNTASSPRPIAARPYAELESDGRVVGPAELVSRRPGEIQIRTQVPDRGATLLVREQSFPGWRVRVDGGSWMTPPERRGFLAVDLPGGAHEVRLRYGWRTGPRLLGLGISTIAGLICAWLGWRRS